MEITNREIIASISILAIMLILGFFISDKIQTSKQDGVAKYSKAVKIKEEDIFSYSMRTNVGNAFVEGELKALEPVSFEDIKGDYLKVDRVQERYTMHTRTVTTTVNGKSSTRIETYWTWDVINRDSKTSPTVNFLGIDFDTSKFNLPDTEYIDTVSDGHNLRSKYYGYPVTSDVTIFSNLKDDTISDNTTVYTSNMATTVETLTSYPPPIMFWVIWTIITFFIIYLFCYLDNDWLY